MIIEVRCLSNGEVSYTGVHSAVAAAAAALCVVIPDSFSFFYVHTVDGFTTDYLDLV